MIIIHQDFDYLPEIDVLVRVYKNQNKKCSEEEQVVAEILFKPYLNINHIRCTSWLPRGAANFIVTTLNKHITNKEIKTIQISNELPNEIGVLTSCRSNFENSLEWKNLKINQYEKSN